MKSFSKFCLILAGIFVVLGIVGVTAGMALGARPSQFLHVVHYGNSGWLWNPFRIAREWRDDALDWKEDALDWKEDTLDWLDDDWDYEDNLEDGRLDDLEDLGDDIMKHWKEWTPEEIVKSFGGTGDHFEGTFGEAGVKNLKLELNEGIVKFYTRENAGIWIQGSNAKDYLKIIENGDTLVLEDHRRKREKPVVLEIYLPQTVMEKLELEMGACMIYAEDLSAEKIEIHAGAGEAEVKTIRAGKLDLDLGAGLFEVEEINVTEKAEIEVGTGELTARYFTGGDLDLDCGVGYISMTAAGRESDYNYELSCGIGDLELNGKSYAGLGREQTINNQASKKITMECGIGSIELKFED